MDREALVVFCLEDIIRTTPLGTGGVIVLYNQPTATDNSGTVVISSNSHNPGDFFVTGSTQVSYIFADPSGITASCVFVVTVEEGKDWGGVVLI